MTVIGASIYGRAAADRILDNALKNCFWEEITYPSVHTEKEILVKKLVDNPEKLFLFDVQSKNAVDLFSAVSRQPNAFLLSTYSATPNERINIFHKPNSDRVELFNPTREPTNQDSAQTTPYFLNSEPGKLCKITSSYVRIDREEAAQSSTIILDTTIF